MSDFIVILWIVLVIVAGIVAARKNRFWLGWMVISAVLSPITLLILLALPPITDDDPATKRIQCPECAEAILATAKICRFCGHKLSDNQKPKNATDEDEAQYFLG